MNSPMFSAPVSSRRNRWSTRLFVVIAGLACSSVLFAQADPNDPAAGGRNRRGQNGQNGGQGGFGGQGGPGGGRGGNFDPAQMQQQQMDRMREQFEVTDDAEWKLITDRITAVTEARQGAAGMGGFGGGGRGGAGGPGGQGGQRGGRGGRGGNVEQQALQQAIADKLPDAEIKARLERLRDSRKAAEEKLARAQENLRAVLSVRQEAVAVMAGLLP